MPLGLVLGDERESDFELKIENRQGRGGGRLWRDAWTADVLSLLVSFSKKILFMCNEVSEKGTEIAHLTPNPLPSAEREKRADTGQIGSERSQGAAPSPVPSPPMGERENSAGAGFYRHAGGKRMTELCLANLLRPYGVRPRSVWIGEQSAKGYAKEDFVDVVGRYSAAALKQLMNEWGAVEKQGKA